jgi:hypothetical protein
MIKQTKLAQVLEVLEENPHLIEIVQGWAQVVYPHLATPPAQPAQPAPVPEGSVSKGAYNRMRDDYNDLVNRSEQDAKDAKQWRKHVTYCQLQGVDLDYQLATPPAPQRTEQEPVAWMYEDDYQRMLTSETFCKVWSVEVGSATRGETTVPLYTTSPQRKPLLASEIVTMYAERPTSDNDMIEFARAIEAAHGIKENT